MLRPRLQEGVFVAFVPVERPIEKKLWNASKAWILLMVLDKSFDPLFDKNRAMK
jgi:hypothetical protein